MAYSALAVANAFIEQGLRGNIPRLTPMKLQKLLFFAQSWHLRKNGPNAPLFDDNFARWKYGPVIPSLYHELKTYGSSPITSMLRNVENDDEGGFVLVTPSIPASDANAHELIDAIITKYGRLTGSQLSFLTHEDGTAWQLGLEDGEANGSVITWEQMASHIHPPSRMRG
ncbi:Panacea domain-containing protein [Pseudomonas sp. DE0010]|uniref:Panacea domain-containing protein n=1 Tax=Pseudomonas sp. DE0010 TaxID=2584951 RepID=UPI00119FD9E9|nr:type II toxin-antitoxin system antitoxin SocA domain-containing protein [Pseudomonas sp. DE0010]